MLFNIFTNDFTDKLIEEKNLFPQIFADDTNILGTTTEKLVNTIKIAEKWAEENGMSINKNKSKIMIIGDQKPPDKQNLIKHIKEFTITSAYKSLGIIIQDNGKLDK